VGGSFAALTEKNRKMLSSAIVQAPRSPSLYACSMVLPRPPTGAFLSARVAFARVASVTRVQAFGMVLAANRNADHIAAK
jgi:hypothetical protein